MTQRCIVVGAGGHARVVLSLLLRTQAGRKYAPVFVADLATGRKAGGESILGCPVKPLPDDLSAIAALDISTAFIAVGENAARRRHFEEFARAGFELPNLVSEGAYVDPSARLGLGNLVAHGAHVGPCVQIGDDNIVNTNANVEHESQVGDHCHLAPGSIICGRVHVGSLCHVGAGSIVIENTRIADEVFVGAGAVVVSDIDKRGVLCMGVPAREVNRS